MFAPRIMTTDRKWGRSVTPGLTARALPGGRNVSGTQASPVRQGGGVRPSGLVNTKGGALLMVLWASAALASIAFSVATTVRSETGRVAGTADGLRAWYLATGSVERAIQWMLWGQEFGPKYWLPNNKPFLTFSYASGDAVVEMIPESAKLSINQATEDDLVRVIAAVSGNVSKAHEIATGIIDWRAGGSGSPTLGPSTFSSPHASFQEIEELLFVNGMTPELFYGNYVSDNEGRLYPTGGLRDCLSVWGSSGP